MGNGGLKDLRRRTASDEILQEKALNIVNDPKHFEYQRGIASMV